ncbi:MAG TPA: D-alanyl-D-alanine carboxypeptidase [Thermodesulfobacteriota bacterium]|nr:D-alanyl-D-alanine carboxypeptidase [Thermodesulfobacteriota bacterium]
MVKTLKFIVIIFSIIVLVIDCPDKSQAKINPNEFVSAKAAFLMDADTGAILYQKNPDLRLPPASTTKVMTAIVALENGQLDSVVCATKHASSVQPCKVEIRSGEEWRMDDLLRCILLNSANDACIVIAEGSAGSITNFTRQMNLKAKEIGANNTHFSNPHGLDQRNHYSTARDLVLIFRYAMNNPTFREIVQTESMSIQGPNQRLIYLRNHNKLLGRYAGMIGGKTGYTRRASKCFVGEAQQNGKNLLVCVLGSKNHFQDVVKLLDFGFNEGGTNKGDGVLKITQHPEIAKEESSLAISSPQSKTGSYVLQVASFSDSEKALGLNQTLSDNGYPSFVEKTALKNGDVRHRVKVGVYQNLSSAQKTKECIWKYFGLNPIILHQEIR